MDWCTALRRSTLAAFILLTVFAIVQATSQYTIWYSGDPHYLGIYSGSIQQFLFITLWPFTYAPIWFKVTYFTLAIWLCFNYVWWLDVA